MQVIAETIQKIVLAEKPKFRYKISGMSKSLTLMKAILPQNMFENMVLNIFKLPAKVEY